MIVVRAIAALFLVLAAGCAVQPPQPEVRPERDTTGAESDDRTRARIHTELKKPVWADVASRDQAVAAVDCGADAVSTTMYGYTEETRLPPEAGPDFALLEAICLAVAVPVILEGRVWHPDEVTRAFAVGAHAVVVGSAITRPQLITRRFVQAIPARRK